MKAGKTKSAFIVEAIDEKLGLVKNRQNTIRQLASWMTYEEAGEMRTSLKLFNKINGCRLLPPFVNANYYRI